MGPVGLGVAVALMFFLFVVIWSIYGEQNDIDMVDRYQENIVETFSNINTCLCIWDH